MQRSSKNDLAKTARGTVGVLGIGFSNAYKYIEDDQHRYSRSLDPQRHIPPSLFISERDGVRNGAVMPLSERCIEDFGTGRPASLSGDDLPVTSDLIAPDPGQAPDRTGLDVGPVG